MDAKRAEMIANGTIKPEDLEDENTEDGKPKKSLVVKNQKKDKKK